MTVIHNNPLVFQGLIVRSRLESLQQFKKPWAHEHEPVKTLLDAVKVRSASNSVSVPSRILFPIIVHEIYSQLSLSGNQANGSNRFIRSRKDIHQGGG